MHKSLSQALCKCCRLSFKDTKRIMFSYSTWEKVIIQFIKSTPSSPNFLSGVNKKKGFPTHKAPHTPKVRGGVNIRSLTPNFQRCYCQDLNPPTTLGHNVVKISFWESIYQNFFPIISNKIQITLLIQLITYKP